MTSLWNLIRDWFVQYIWGGITSSGNIFYLNMGNFMYSTEDNMETYNGFTESTYIPINVADTNYMGGGYQSYMSIGDWLSTTSTIIVLVLLCVAFGFLVVGIFRLFSRMFALRS